MATWAVLSLAQRAAGYCTSVSLIQAHGLQHLLDVQQVVVCSMNKPKPYLSFGGSTAALLSFKLDHEYQ